MSERRISRRGLLKGNRWTLAELVRPLGLSSAVALPPKLRGRAFAQQGTPPSFAANLSP
jgi:hypothetical protein